MPNSCMGDFFSNLSNSFNWTKISFHSKTRLKLAGVKQAIQLVSVSVFYTAELFSCNFRKSHRQHFVTVELGRNLLGRRFLKWALFVSCTTSHVGLCSFLESIEHDFIKAMKIQAGN